MGRSLSGKMKWLAPIASIHNKRALSEYLSSSIYRKAIATRASFGVEVTKPKTVVSSKSVSASPLFGSAQKRTSMYYALSLDDPFGPKWTYAEQQASVSAATDFATSDHPLGCATWTDEHYGMWSSEVLWDFGTGTGAANCGVFFGNVYCTGCYPDSFYDGCSGASIMSGCAPWWVFGCDSLDICTSDDAPSTTYCFYGGDQPEFYDCNIDGVEVCGHETLAECQADTNCDQCIENTFCGQNHGVKAHIYSYEPFCAEKGGYVKDFGATETSSDVLRSGLWWKSPFEPYACGPSGGYENARYITCTDPLDINETTFTADPAIHEVIASSVLNGVNPSDIYAYFPELANLIEMSSSNGFAASYIPGTGWIGTLIELEGEATYNIKFSQETTTNLFYPEPTTCAELIGMGEGIDLGWNDCNGNLGSTVDPDHNGFSDGCMGNGNFDVATTTWIDTNGGGTGIVITLAGANLSWKIGCLTNLTSLMIYGGSDNQLTGEIPSEIGNLTNLTDLYLPNNELTGEIPNSIGNLTNLTTLYLGNNQLTGEIPNSIGNLTNLNSLNLGNNQLTGEIPSEIGNLTNLTNLFLDSNQLTGSIPTEVGALPNLSRLNLESNSLSGEIPPFLSTEFDIMYGIFWAYGNDFSGIIPDSICNVYDQLPDPVGGNFDIQNNDLCPPYPICSNGQEIPTAGFTNSGPQDVSNCTVTDIDGNVYPTIRMGAQLWMAENLKVTKYNDGSDIQYVQQESSEPNVWENLSTGAYGYYNDDPTHQATYGNLYNWYTVDDSRGVCPAGYHVPSNDEYKELEMFLGMSQSEADSTDWRGTTEGAKLAGNSGLWTDGNLDSNAEFGTSGFNALPGGYRRTSVGTYSYMGDSGYFWSSSVYGPYGAWTRNLNYGYSSVNRYGDDKHDGSSIRCVHVLEHI